MTTFQMVILCIIGIATVSLLHSIYLMVTSNAREEEFEDTQRQMNCLKNEINHITQESIKNNNQPHTIHGQFQIIVNNIDQILDGKSVYDKPNYWETH